MPKRRPSSFDRLPTWLPPRSLAAWLKISKTKANLLIAAAPPRQRRGLTVSKYWVQSDANLAKKCRKLILELLQDKSFPHRALLQKEVQLFLRSHGR